MSFFLRNGAALALSARHVTKDERPAEPAPIDTSRGRGRAMGPVGYQLESEEIRHAIAKGVGAIDLSARANGVRKSEQDVIDDLRYKMDAADIQRIAAYFRERYPVVSETVSAAEWENVALKLFLGLTPGEQQAVLAMVADKAKPDSAGGRSQTQPDAETAAIKQAADRDIANIIAGLQQMRSGGTRQAAKSSEDRGRPLMDTAFNRGIIEQHRKSEPEIVHKSADGRVRVVKFDTSVPGSLEKKRRLAIEMDVRRLTDVDVSHISLVKRAATRAPFKVAKAEGALAAVPALSDFDRALSRIARGARA